MAGQVQETGPKIYCPGCGVELKPDVEDQNFCEFCGTPLSPAPAPATPADDTPAWLQELHVAPTAAAEPVEEAAGQPAETAPGWLEELHTASDAAEAGEEPEAETMPDWLEEVVEPPPAAERLVPAPRPGPSRVVLTPKTPRHPEPEPDSTPQPAAIIVFFVLGMLLLLGLLFFLGLIAVIR
ncbi:MAG: hypothetical protein PVH11_10145 [Anaerolineae bacterium]